MLEALLYLSLHLLKTFRNNDFYFLLPCESYASSLLGAFTQNHTRKEMVGNSSQINQQLMEHFIMILKCGGLSLWAGTML